jgi:uncharacterized protein (TIGR01244 family)
MKIAKLTPFLAVSPQIAEADLGALAAQGFRAVINNRPDGEAEDQPESAALAAAAGRVGLEYRQVPVVSGRITDDDVAAFAQALDEVKGRYSRSAALARARPRSGRSPRPVISIRRLRRDQAGFLKDACATLDDDGFRIEERKSDVAGTTVARDPTRTLPTSKPKPASRPTAALERRY